MRLAAAGNLRRFPETLIAFRFKRACLTFLLWSFSICSTPAQEVTFPLRAAPQRHYLEDSKGRPFLITGDTAWSLAADLSLADAEFYLDTRKRQGFNTILMSLIEHKFARHAPANFYREMPFVGAAFDRPNDAYFARVETLVEAAGRRNMLVLLCPAYLGAGGGEEGWYQEMVAAGHERLKAYGRYIGRRFGRFSNVVWVQGGDYDPPDRSLVDAIAEGIKDVAPNALQTVHANRDTVTNVFWQHAPWLGIDTVYTYDDAGTAVFARRLSGPQRPFFLIEGKYEGEHRVDESDIRLAAYGALLSGAGGQIFGNNPVWHFSATGLFGSLLTWRQALVSPGARSMTVLARLFSRLDWWKLVPERDLLPADAAAGSGKVFAARDADGTFAVIYVLHRPHIALNLDSLPDGDKELRWYDPSTGFLAGNVERFEGKGVRTAAVPLGTNDSGFDDWVGILASTLDPIR